MESVPCDADAVRVRRELGVSEIEHGTTAVIGAMQPLDAATCGADRAAKLHCIEHGEPGRLDQHARADRSERGGLFVDHDIRVEASRDRDRCRETGRARADDRNPGATPRRSKRSSGAFQCGPAQSRNRFSRSS